MTVPSTPTSSRRSRPTCGCARRRAPRSCSSRSTRAGSAATRSSAAATALVSFAGGREADAPVVGYLGYDHVARLEPTVPLPDDGPDVPESRFVVADVFLRFDHVTGTADVLHGDRDGGRRGARTARRASRRDEPVAGGATVRAPDQAEHERRVAPRQEHIRRGDAFQIVLSQRAERPTIGVPARRLPRAPAHQPVAVPVPARARRPRARRLVARDAREGRGTAGEPQPDRRHDRARRRATPSGCSPRRRTAPST